MFFARGEKPIEGQRILSHMGMNQQGNFGVKITHGGKRGKWHGNQVAHAANIENDLIGSFFEQAAAKESDHRMKVLPLRSGGVNAGKKRCESSNWIVSFSE